MAEFLLIHGSGHGAWCWRDVIPALKMLGHDARAIDLPGCGADRTPAAEVTLASCTNAVIAAIDRPVILVGHSLAGITITEVAEAIPERVMRLVFVTAWAPKHGQSARDQRVATGCEALLQALISEDDGLTTSFRADLVVQLLYHDCPPDAVALALGRLRPQPSSVGSTPVTVTERGLSPPRSFILCEHDRAIPPAAQAAQCAGWNDIHKLPCGHSPFFALPDRLAATLDRISLKP